MDQQNESAVPVVDAEGVKRCPVTGGKIVELAADVKVDSRMFLGARPTDPTPA